MEQVGRRQHDEPTPDELADIDSLRKFERAALALVQAIPVHGMPERARVVADAMRHLRLGYGEARRAVTTRT